MDNELNNTLELCPFCNGFAYVNHQSPFGYDIVSVRCSGCGCSTESFSKHRNKDNPEQMAIDNWQRRVKDK
jgi:hypothetical protein